MSEFEIAVFKWIADRCCDPALRAQLQAADVLSREHTGVGCFSEISVPETAPPSEAEYGQRGPLKGPGFASSALGISGGSLLWFEGGIAKSLEVFTYGNEFPSDHEDLGAYSLLEDSL